MHRVAAAVSDVRGRVVRSLGDIDEPVFLRSAAKPFIAAAVVASGAAARFELTPREIAVMAASHNGEAFHLAAVASVLEKVGLDASALRCGAHAPSYEPAAAALARAGAGPTALHNNCSGKHAGILALCRHLGDDVASYLAAEHPAQRRILAFCARLTGDDPARMPLAIDGCGIPVFATPLRRAALAFARFATLEGLADDDALALRTVRDAMAAEPAYVAGSERFDSALIATTHGRIVGKAGAEGVHADALLGAGLGLALKVVDGARRAAPPATMALLDALGAFSPPERAALARFARPEIRNVAGDGVGYLTTEPDTIEVRVAS
ncbi:MAG: asparaginase [Vulcanimicrobiaceae bacterium]